MASRTDRPRLLTLEQVEFGMTQSASSSVVKIGATSRRAPRKSGSGRLIAPTSGPVVWAVGGGKGGVGKSVITASLGVALAARGPRCVVIDADLGGANLHTLLGVSNPRHTLSDFLSGKVQSLSDVMSPTSVPGLFLVSGARSQLNVANMHHAQKRKLLRHIARLGVSQVLLDLGAGSAFNVVDFFLAAQRGILVVAPEPTSIENAYQFLKTAFYRSLRSVADDPTIRAVLETALSNRSRSPVSSPRELIASVMEIDRHAGAALAARARAFSPLLIVNQVDQVEHRKVGLEIAAACELYLGTQIAYIGALDRDPRVPVAVSRQQPVLQLFPGCSFAEGVGAIADRLLSAEFLERSTESGESERPTPPLATHGLFGEAPPSSNHERRVGSQRPSLPRLDTSDPGGYLRRCREHLGLPIAELSRRTRIRRLDRIEDERFVELPPEPYLQDHVRQYARSLGVGDAEAAAVATSYLERYRRWRSLQSRA